MRTLPCLLGLIGALFAVGSKAAAPDTPAGKVFTKWLEAFNRGDRAEFQQFLEKYWPSRLSRLDQEMEFRSKTGGFEVVRVESSAATILTGIVKGRADSHQARVNCEVEPQEPHRIVRLGLRIIMENDSPTPERVSEAEAISALKSEIEKAAAEGTFSGSILVARHGKPIFSGAYGMADRENGKTNTLATQHRIGSMNKMFTATAVLQLVQAGKLKLTDTLGKH